MWDNLVPAPPDNTNPFDMWASMDGGGRTTDTDQAYLQNTGGSTGGNRTVDTWAQMSSPSYLAPTADDDEPGTDTDASSDDGVEDTEPMNVSNMTEAKAAEAIFMA